MKIALIDPSLFTWPYDQALLHALKQNGHDALLYGKYLAGNPPEKNDSQYREFFYRGFQGKWLQALPGSLFLLLKGLSHPFYMLKLLRELKCYCPDIIHFQWAPLPVIDRFFLPAFRRIAPVVFTVHDSAPFNNNPRSQLQRLSAIAIMHGFDKLIVHTEQAHKRLIAYGLIPGNIRRIAHGMLESSESAGVKPIPPPTRADESVVMLLFGKLKPYKGADILIRALALMPPELRALCRIRIVGKAHMDVSPLYALAQELGVANLITWDLRFIDEDEIAGIFNDADVMVMPYREIDASGVLMVALCVGRPIIASNIGLFSEMLEDAKHGFLVPAENPAALAEAMAALVRDKSLRFTMGENVQALKNAIPGWREIAGTTQALYEEAIAERSDAPSAAP